MKRLRVLNFDFDFTANYLTMNIEEEWDENAKTIHKRNKESIKSTLISRFGELDIENKLSNLEDIGVKNASIIGFHNKFIEQIRRAYIIGSYYPAATATFALGERILNHLILKLRKYYKTTDFYKKVYNKDSIDNWTIAINGLDSWKVLIDNVKELYMKLYSLRYKVIHYYPELDNDEKALTKESINILQHIINKQFGAFGNQPWFIQGTLGCSFIKKEYEANPYIKEIYLPSCYMVGIHHKLETIDNKTVLKDDYPYENKEITDIEFKDSFNELRHPGHSATA